MQWPCWLTRETRAKALSTPSFPTPTISQSMARAFVGLEQKSVTLISLCYPTEFERQRQRHVRETETVCVCVHTCVCVCVCVCEGCCTLLYINIIIKHVLHYYNYLLHLWQVTLEYYHTVSVTWNRTMTDLTGDTIILPHCHMWHRPDR